ncbi:hypothetical protein NB640_12885 [Oxalobacter vibrioformis]|uniref:Uncharacterized protein n=1 Tax=Oxalobacter vibrioformis TaxID=933080 RepID=A0A9E9LXJ4_9BURK|nr:hypothetical protein [Oxalobacter vibrioformis]WAW10091.1 hypothetical protein NB640_12885 [Oxalobacter vibrioformis]
MNLKTIRNTLPFFWKLYIVCMFFAALRMGEPDWEWEPASISPWPAFIVSAQEVPLQDTDVIVARSASLPH